MNNPVAGNYVAESEPYMRVDSSYWSLARDGDLPGALVEFVRRNGREVPLTTVQRVFEGFFPTRGRLALVSEEGISNCDANVSAELVDLLAKVRPTIQVRMRGGILGETYIVSGGNDY